MIEAGPNNLDYLAARVHGRYSRLAKAERLDALCRVQSIPELARSVYPASDLQSAIEFQRRLAQDLAGELSDLLANLAGPGADLFAWVLVRFQVENLKVLLRGFLNHVPLGGLKAHLIPLPRNLELDAEALASAGSLKELVELLPNGKLQASLEEARSIYGDRPKPFFLEAGLDRAYFEELLARTARLPREEREVIQPMMHQEANIFNLMLVARGRFHYGLAAELLMPLRVDGASLSRARVAGMLGDPDLQTSVRRAGLGVVWRISEQAIEGLARIDAAALETRMWNRFLGLAERALRRSPIGLGAILGYTGIRRVEVANLITLSEGIRAGLAGEAIRSRLIPRANLESAYV